MNAGLSIMELRLLTVIASDGDVQLANLENNGYFELLLNKDLVGAQWFPNKRPWVTGKGKHYLETIEGVIV
jgi:hypothetical protein